MDHNDQRRGHVSRSSHREEQRRSHHAKPYERRGGRGNHNRGQDHSQPHQQEETPEQRISSFLVRVGDKINLNFKDAVEALAKIIDREYRQHSELILKTMRACITELPMKSSVYATLVSVVNRRSPDTAELFVRMAADALQQALNRANWRQVKLLVIYANLLRCFTAVLEEPQVRRARADCMAYILMDALVYSALELKKRASNELDALLSFLDVYMQARQQQQQTLPINVLKVFRDEVSPYPQNEVISLLWQQLNQLRGDNWELPMLPKVYTMMEDLLINNRQHSLPTINIPEDKQTTKYPGVKVEFQLFIDNLTPESIISVPATTSIARHVLRDMISDILELYEVNRKECLKYLMVLREYFQPATFNKGLGKATPSGENDGDTAMPEVTSDVGGWQIEAIITEVILGKLFELPAPEQKLVYYGVVLMEMCKAVSDTFPPVISFIVCLFVYFGRAISLLFDSIDHMDVGCVYRFCDFFAHHLSNFGFHWNWAEWSSVLQLERTSPRRVFVRETLNKSIQLSYYDRIKTNIPEGMQVMIPPVAPSPRFKFGGQAAAKANPDQVALANALMEKLKSRAEMNQVRALLNEYVIGSNAEDNNENADDNNGTAVDEERQRQAREVLFQCVLMMGSKSFSHMMNITERCLPLLKEYTTEAESKLQVVRIIETFWFENTQFLGIIIDRFLTYRLIEAVNIVQWLFDDKHTPHFDRFHYWAILHRSISKMVSKTREINHKLVQIREAHAVNESKRMVDAMDDELEQQRAEKKGIAKLEATYDLALHDKHQVLLALFQSLARVLSLKLAEYNQQGIDASMQPWLFWTMGWMREFGRYYHKELGSIWPTLSSSIPANEVNPVVLQEFETIHMLITDQQGLLQQQQ
ncbi:MIF4G like-domain-containing protein [Syncephalis plumigaleata]|nr:MIF4G like-domain-containing protein [Syncephalis plumigaleata]